MGRNKLVNLPYVQCNSYSVNKFSELIVLLQIYTMVGNSFLPLKRFKLISGDFVQVHVQF